jgi:methyl-accepting chemotaxis protein
MYGLRAGIVAGRSGGDSAMRSAALAASAPRKYAQNQFTLGVFRDEIGRMAMRGFGQGVLLETNVRQVIQNASRYLTGAAKHVRYDEHHDNRRTYNQSSNVNSLATRSMSVTNRISSVGGRDRYAHQTQQRGRGLRMRNARRSFMGKNHRCVRMAGSH